MIAHISQSTFGGPDAEPGLRGDCFSACLASLLRVPLAEVPRFCEIDGDDWQDAIDAWLAQFSLIYVEVKIDVRMIEALARAGYHILNGPGSGGHPHSVVGFRTVTAWDPHPNRSGLRGSPTEWTVGFLVPRYPTIVREIGR